MGEKSKLDKVVEFAVAGTLATSAIAGASLAGRESKSYTSPEVSNSPMTEPYTGENMLQEPKSTVKNTEPLVEPTLVPTESWKPSFSVSPTEIVREFDQSVVEFSEWNKYSLEVVEDMKPGYTGVVSEESSLYMIPLKKDNFVDNKDGKYVKGIKVGKDTRFEIAQVRTLKGPNDEIVRVGAVANTFGEHSVSILLLSATDKYGNVQKFVNESLENERTVSYVVSEESIYPNKIINTLIALENISEYQLKNGPMVAGQTQSYLDMIKLKDSSEISKFNVGLTSSEKEIKGGGVCAMATAISSLVNISSGGNPDIVEQWAHPIRYSQGPFSPSEYKVDATVGLDPVYDFKWIQDKTKYLKVNIHLSPSDIAYEDTNSNGVGGVSDANLIVSISFTDDIPENQDKYIHNFLEDYKAFRETKHSDTLYSDKEGADVKMYPMKESVVAVDNLYSAEEIRYFGEYIERNKDIQNIFELQDAVNSFPAGSDMRLDEYLYTTKWYRNFVNDENKENVNRILSLVSNTRIEGQPLQCVGFVMLTSWLYPDLNIPYVGGIPTNSASGLIPPEVRNYAYKDTFSMFSGISNTIAVVGKSIPLEEYESGNLFVRVDGGKVAGSGEPTGHVGVILGKTLDENGKAVLLVADANRHNDGKIKIFEVNESNKEEIFGYPNVYILKYMK